MKEQLQANKAKKKPVPKPAPPKEPTPPPVIKVENVKKTTSIKKKKKSPEPNVPIPELPIITKEPTPEPNRRGSSDNSPGSRRGSLLDVSPMPSPGTSRRGSIVILADEVCLCQGSLPRMLINCKNAGEFSFILLLFLLFDNHAWFFVLLLFYSFVFLIAFKVTSVTLLFKNL